MINIWSHTSLPSLVGNTDLYTNIEVLKTVRLLGYEITQNKSTSPLLARLNNYSDRQSKTEARNAVIAKVLTTSGLPDC